MLQVRTINLYQPPSSQVCVLQSTLDFLEQGYDVHVLADGVSSCNKEEVPLALRGCSKLVHRLRPVRACCSSCKVRTLRPIFSMGDTNGERCHTEVVLWRGTPSALCHFPRVLVSTTTYLTLIFSPWFRQC